MSTYNQVDGAGSRTLAAIFTDRDSAHDALLELRDAGFHKFWVGVVRADAARGTEPTLQPEGGSSFTESLGKFFSGEELGAQSFAGALTGRGLSAERAQGIAGRIVTGNAIVTVEADGNYDEAADILKDLGGQLDTPHAAGARPLGTSRAGSVVVDAAAATAATGLDETQRIQLREERLLVDTQLVSGGEAQFRKAVVTERQSVDVPVYHEEVHIERRPVSGAGATATTPIGDGEEIRVPLMAERVDVTKSVVATEDVIIGKRRVENTQHVDETVRREELIIDDRTRSDAANLS